MALDELKNIEKLEILAYSSSEEVGAPGAEVASIETVFNIGSYNRKYENVYQGALTAGINTSSRPARYSYSQPSYLNFQLFFDATGLHKSAVEAFPLEVPSVTEQVDNFLDVCYHYDGEIHQPRYLLIKWGTLAFQCRLLSADVKYTLFDKGGQPIRAELDVSFIEDISEAERVKREDKKSPDISRSYTFVAGDSLPALAKKYYGSASYYLMLARANGINHFREIEIGRNIQFPTLEELKIKFSQ